MSTWLLWCYLFALMLALCSIFITLQLQLRFSYPFLRTFLYFVILDAFQTILDLFLRILPHYTHWFGAQGMPKKPLQLLDYLIFTISVFMNYFLILSVYKLARRACPKWFLRLYWGASSLVFVAFSIGLAFYFSGRSRELPRLILLLADLNSAFFPSAVLFLGLYWTSQMKQGAGRHLLQAIFVYLQIIFFMYYWVYILRSANWRLLNLFIVDPFFKFVNVHLLDLCSIAYIFPVILLMRFFLKTLPPPESSESLPQKSRQLDMHGLSKREWEITTLIIQGYSNRQIEDKLFISCRTVENHIYNIYRKLGVKNRIQLLRVFAPMNEFEL
jgi:DNA-binding CsgD family transcriptional regulator